MDSLILRACSFFPSESRLLNRMESAAMRSEAVSDGTKELPHFKLASLCLVLSPEVFLPLYKPH